MTNPQTILDEVNSKLEEAIGGLHKWERLYKELQDKYNELALQSFKQKALAQPEQEPVAWLVQYKDRHEFVWGAKPEFRGDTVFGIEPLYTAPPKREWVGLTEGEFRAIGQRFENDNGHVQAWMSFARHIQFALKEKNHGRI
jgi:hypothetical protein